MILRDASELARYIFSKSLINSKFFSKQVFELSLQHCLLGFRAMFILMLVLNHHSAKKQGNKRDLVWLISLNSFEMVFILLAKAIAI